VRTILHVHVYASTSYIIRSVRCLHKCPGFNSRRISGKQIGRRRRRRRRGGGGGRGEWVLITRKLCCTCGNKGRQNRRLKMRQLKDPAVAASAAAATVHRTPLALFSACLKETPTHNTNTAAYKHVPYHDPSEQEGVCSYAAVLLVADKRNIRLTTRRLIM